MAKDNQTAARKFLDLNWEKKIYKDPDLEYDDLATMLGFSRYRPSLRMCKNYFGQTIVGFFKHCRVVEIKEFLSRAESRKYELNEISTKYGYKSLRYFNESFKKVTGITPRDFWFFHEHFVKTTGITLAEYQQPETQVYIPDDGNPTLMSNFLNRHAANIQKMGNVQIKGINE
jgi:AraC-like DNA-binding protein